jgi:hypothetical protein
LTQVVVHIDRTTTRTAELVPAFAYVHGSAVARCVPGGGFFTSAASLEPRVEVLAAFAYADDFPARLIGRFAR